MKNTSKVSPQTSSPNSRQVGLARLIKVGHVTVAIYEIRNHGRRRFRVYYYADERGRLRRARTFANLAEAEHFASVVAPLEAQHHPRLGIISPTVRSTLHGQMPAVITVATARQSLQALATHGTVSDALFFALGLFAGLRRDELDQLEMNDIVPGRQIRVPARMTSKCRIIPVLPVLHAWLSPFHSREGRLVECHHPIHRIARVLQQQGLAWPRNGLRQSFVAYRLTATNNLHQTALECGISPAIMANHHLRLVTAAQATEYFALTPAACGITDWPERVQAFFAALVKAGDCPPRLEAIAVKRFLN